jgi:cysteine desulfurase / selenocysteine lyase
MMLEQTSGLFDVEAVRRQFPILQQRVHGRPLVYLDNAATTQKPQAVLDAELRYYREANANVHRGVHHLSELATASYEGARETVRRFINAPSTHELVFVRGATEAINLVAQTFGPQQVGPGDEVLVTGMEHHSNIVPWQMLCESRGARLVVVPVDGEGELMLPELERLLSPRTRLFAVAHVSNALGTVNPIRPLVSLAHARGIPVLVDGAQAAGHLEIDVQALGCDFYVFSGHKMFGPTGIGVLWAREELLEQMPPWQGGGEMIVSVSFERTTYNRLPWRFEAGTPNIAGAVGLGAAIDWLQSLDRPAAAAHERALLASATRQLEALDGLRVVGTAPGKISVLSFVVPELHPHDLGTALDREGIAIRAGHHCAQPLMQRFGVMATARASFALYNNAEDVEALVAGVRRARELFQ